ncbi:SDR family NAD(P)-dependent oxidoreductase [Parapedobacter indicus]|uniref:Short-chain dehydrogenase n=1 Tax=Parapedobacter indicus TaxID=1477437 RepID=A0A1I3CXS7_9SPHI|nr:SDR family NAD(P)-dependent oxidoreductase [Parapedobacter indicus]PPL04442.1 short-subunit dehydrogenase [Parapedobacter indicus]SFH79233.1 Short-chain dehydrogenase [Parapedobacter indicus]
MERKKIMIIGATSGIGRALAELLVAEGHTVGITGRREELLVSLAVTSPEQYRLRSFDVTDTGNAVANLEELAIDMDGVDLVVISAGGGDVNPSLDFDTEHRMIALNVAAFTCLADWAFNYFKRQGHGQLAAITSVAGMRGSRQAPAYSATKAYQVIYLQGLRQKARKEQTGIVITDICPGFVDTPAAKSPARFWVSPLPKAARQIYRGLCRRRNVVYITARWRIVAWLYRWLPNWLHERM